jgi:hypothetical protein
VQLTFIQEANMSLRLIGAVAGLAFSVIASQASATVVNFNSLGPDASQFGPEYQEGGLTFTSSDPQSTSFGNWGSGTSENADPTGATLFPNWTLTTMTVALTGGGTFDLASIDLADVGVRWCTELVVYVPANRNEGGHDL